MSEIMGYTLTTVGTSKIKTFMYNINSNSKCYLFKQTIVNTLKSSTECIK